MGYTLRIGEATINWHEESVRIDVDGVKHDDAPAFDEPTDYTNARWPSYSSWSNFCRDMGLTNVMLNERNGGCGELKYGETYLYPLMPEHPGAAPITKAHLQYVEEKVAAYKAANPDHRAEYPPPRPDARPVVGTLYRDVDLVDDPTCDGNLCRAEWLLYWMRWAVENCEKPVFVNS